MSQSVQKDLLQNDFQNRPLMCLMVGFTFVYVAMVLEPSGCFAQFPPLDTTNPHTVVESGADGDRVAGTVTIDAPGANNHQQFLYVDKDGNKTKGYVVRDANFPYEFWIYEYHDGEAVETGLLMWSRSTGWLWHDTTNGSHGSLWQPK